ncbi:MAG: ABC transporter substrate-binding protein [Phycisphaerae bacterium]|nr:ABC transporter substrate-binding protein [Phycisphaerae bacterium]
MRVVSLLPSATETLCLVGGGAFLVGRSHECDFPTVVRSVPALTSQLIDPAVQATPAEIDRTVSNALGSGQSLYRLDSDRLRQLRPDVILTQDLCRVCSIDLDTVRAAASTLDPRPTILALNPHSFEEVLDDILAVGRAVGLQKQAENALIALRERFFRAADHVNAFAARPSVALLEWADPLFIAGHWTPQLIERAGADHPFNPTQPMPGAGDGAGGQMAHRIAGPSRRINPNQLIEAAPDHLIIAPCGVSLADIPAHVRGLVSQGWFRDLPAVRNNRVALVDGNQMFNRPGPRLVDAYEWLVGWLNHLPHLVPADFPWTAWRPG